MVLISTRANLECRMFNIKEEGVGHAGLSLCFPFLWGGVPPPASSLGANPEAASKLCSPASGNPPCPVASSQLCHGLAGAEAYEWGSLIPLPCSH
jgi:hypothetical protein